MGAFLPGPAAVGRGEPRRGHAGPGRRPGGAIRGHAPKSDDENDAIRHADDELPVSDATLVDPDQSPPRRDVRPAPSGRARRLDPDAKAGLQTARHPLPVGPPPVARISLNLRVKSTSDRPMPTLKYYKLPCARLTGAGYQVPVPSGEGLAPHSGREPCGGPVRGPAKCR